MSCKVPIPTGLLDLDAPTLPAFDWHYRGYHVYVVCCDHCGVWNNHGPADGHRWPHCLRDDCPYRWSGYNVTRVGSILGIPQAGRRLRMDRRTVVGMIERKEIGGMVYGNRLFVAMFDLSTRGSSGLGRPSPGLHI